MKKLMTLVVVLILAGAGWYGYHNVWPHTATEADE
jgi:hypothetical protein